ncbi:MAG TPA: hypothetical protein VLH58_09775 [Candidatus Methylomirabilis sp.]|nr:hypothetical protein [Candidatus Methylomirabilis sp.]HSD50518.1 hypothetical protein [Candidatus Methylomirabilis sp.]
MRLALTFILLATGLSACGPSLHEREAAWQRAFQMDLEVTHDRWMADRERMRFKNNADAMRALQSQYEEVYARWWQHIDPLSQVILSYTVALASRADRGELGGEEANRLYSRLEADITLGRRTLPNHASQGERDAATLQWWETYWSQHRETYQATPGNPIECRVLPEEAGSNRVECE